MYNDILISILVILGVLAFVSPAIMVDIILYRQRKREQKDKE